MTSPPRRMTRARAKQEGFEPDWRINPHWKTPKKPKAKSLRFALPDTGSEDHTKSVISRGAERIPSPTKIRIPAKVPIQRPLESSPSETARPEPHEPLRKSVLGSPVRVRPRTDRMRTSAVDKENSPLATLSAWSSPKKAGVPKTPSLSSRSRPLEASPTTSNIQQHSASVKILSTPLRVLNPHTPGRHLGSARRIPFKLDEANPKPLSLHPIADVPDPQPLRTSTYPVNRCPPSPNKMTMSAMRKSASPLKLHQNRELEFIDPIPRKPVGVSQTFSVPAPVLATSPQYSPDSTHWTPLKPIQPLQRKMSSSTKPPQFRPSKGQERPPSQVTKKDFYVDASFSSPSKINTGSVQRPASQVPKFPIRRRSIAQPTTLSDGSLPLKALSNEIHLDAIKEFKPTKKVDKWKPPVKSLASAQTLRVHNEARTQRTVTLASTNSTTPNGTPQPRSPKVFDLSDNEDASLNLFTPKKPKVTSHTLPQTAKIANPSDTAVLEIQPKIQWTDKVYGSCLTEPSMQTPTGRTGSNCASDSPEVFDGTAEYHRDITVPIKDACLGNLIAEMNPSSALLSEKSDCVDKRSTKPLHGVIAYVDVRTADGDDAGAPFSDALRTLGAKVVRHWSWNGEEVDRMAITHVIFKQGGPRTLSKVKMAKGAVKCVGLGWISRYTSWRANLTEDVKLKHNGLMKRLLQLNCPRGLMDTRSLPL
jgi:hypothetical protein